MNEEERAEFFIHINPFLSGTFAFFIVGIIITVYLFISYFVVVLVFNDVRCFPRGGMRASFASLVGSLTPSPPEGL
ncbi:hypothetical protein [Cytobacillus oceanisediminis]|uniref:hypothetical protein n=1 Tax=Cytobacillus oceanisediminis TaxID=665099 RepID=UPI00207AD2EF|nr:hypothetical protein [Cytobacillus oceanisediminis]USK46854.1 hypothetical protein LIT27_13695 [Cytobacillus oceanisediminis]